MNISPIKALSATRLPDTRYGSHLGRAKYIRTQLKQYGSGWVWLQQRWVWYQRIGRWESLSGPLDTERLELLP